jgi:Fic family protein
MLKLNNRQNKIIEYISNHANVGNMEIVNFVNKQGEKISRFTVIRDLDILLKDGWIIKNGQGRSIYYEAKNKNSLLKFINVEKYFSVPPDERVQVSSFNFEIFKNLEGLLSPDEKERLINKNKIYQKHLKKLPPVIIKKEFERLTIELSWMSSKIEGNTYSLLETEALLTNNIEAKGKKHDEVVMILNHKKALEFARDRKSDFKKITLRKIENIHGLLVGDLGISTGLRKILVGITGTKYKPLDNEFQIKEAIENLAKAINNEPDFFSKAMLAAIMIAYIQPFEDGNKRTSRLLGNAILMAHNCCPLSYRSIDEVEYKKAVILFYEQNNINYFKKLFIEQFEFAVDNYFGV